MVALIYVVLLVMRTYIVFTNVPTCVCKGLGMLLWSCAVTGLSAGSPMSDESPEPETEGRNVCPCIHTYMHVCVVHLVVCAHTHTHTNKHTHCCGLVMQEDREALVREESKNTAGLSTSLTSSQDSTSEGDVEESEEAAATLHDIMVFDFSNDDTGKEDPPGEDSLSSVASKTGEAATPDEAAQDDLELPQLPSQPPPLLAPTVQGSPPDTQPHNGDCPTHESLIAKLLSADQSTSSLTGSSITSFDEDISFVAPPPPPSFADHPTEADSTTEPSFEGENPPSIIYDEQWNCNYDGKLMNRSTTVELLINFLSVSIQCIYEPLQQNEPS